MSANPEGRQTRLSAPERGRLIEAAATALFAQQGYISTSVDDIVSAVGLTKPMLYRHFESKQRLCIALLERYRDELISAALQEFPRAPDPDQVAAASGVDGDDVLERMIDAWLDWVESHPDATRLLFTPIRGDDVVRTVQEEMFARQRDTQSVLLREFAPSLEPSAVEPLAEISWAGFTAVALWWLSHPDRPRSVARQALVTMARGIISAAPEGAR